MNKKVALIPSYEKCTGPITRAKAVTLASHGTKLLPRAPPIPDKNISKGGKTKRAASDENNTAVLHAVISQNKKRAVLSDVSNVLCDNSYRNCKSIVKKQVKTCTQQSDQLKTKKRSNHKDLKIAPSSSSCSRLFYDDGSIRKYTLKDLSDRGSSFNSEKLDGSMPRVTKMEGHALDVKGILYEDQDKLNCLDIRDIDLDTSNPQMCSLYAADIYNNLRAFELILRPSSTFMENFQREITQGMRGILIDWLIEVTEEYGLAPDTLYLSVYAIDSFLSENCIERQQLQLLGVSCMLIASKYEEICAPRVEEFCYITDNTYTKIDVLDMEIQVLKYLDFRLSVPTIKTFLRRYLRAAQTAYNFYLNSEKTLSFGKRESQGKFIFVSCALLSLNLNKVPSPDLGYIANFLSELTLVEYSFLRFLPSIIAASAVFLARWTLDQSDPPWNHTLEYYTSYKAVDLKSAVVQMHDLQQNSSTSLLGAVREKYLQEKYARVACRVSPKLPDSLFL